MVRHILFDLDGTLYPMHSGMQEFFRERLLGFTCDFLKLTKEECTPLLNGVRKRYGTTLEWLMKEKDFTDINAFMAYVHPENEVDFVPKNPDLRSLIEGLNLPCSILTNSPLFHAQRVIDFLDLKGIFQNIFSIDNFEQLGKPHPSSYRRVLDNLNLGPNDVLFIDDFPEYVEGYTAIGGRGILLDENDVYEDYPHCRIKSLRELTGFLS
ncbi:MAG: HAD-IA family hydrolase [Treponema sp.]|nr:HAD-IA family hydrolase [Treponema sp.]